MEDANYQDRQNLEIFRWPDSRAWSNS